MYKLRKSHIVEDSQTPNTSGWPTVEELIARKDRIARSVDPEWEARYGEASWDAALALLGIEPTDVPMPAPETETPADIHEPGVKE